ncbi:hypothetical protein WH95_19575 [Kiloniella litopenaei]|uniref:Conjugal transfer protein TrbL n=1 Tax=Kiloniella litopenaei TaxID=1549748 RepID=A0A0M2R0S4_9PROT|nr:type IV secretion system protein [Kiloniella litopenaei]KKJ75221.1 hypothetical protein WH95_19575 [Kiloniella litopenaei]
MGKSILRHAGTALSSVGGILWRHSLTILFVVSVLGLVTQHAYAVVTADQLNDKGYMVSNLINLETQMNGLINAAITGSTAFAKHVNYLFLAGLVYHVIITTYGYTRDGSMADVVEAVFYGLFVGILYKAFAELADLVWGWLNEVGATLQTDLLGTDGMFAAPVYIKEVLSNVVWGEEEFSFFSTSVDEIMMSIFFAIGSLVLYAAAFLTAVWPMLGYLIAKPLGLFLIPFLFVKKTAVYFDGFLTLLVGFGLYVIISKIILSMVALLMGGYMAAPYGSVAPNTTVLIKSDGSSDLTFLSIIMIISIFFFAAIPWFVTKIMGGGSFQTSGGLSSLSRVAGRAFKGG